MNEALLSFKCRTPAGLAHRLRSTDIRVPRVGHGRTSQHRERYTMARFLATAYTQGLLSLPLSVHHQDNTGNPDFILQSRRRRLGAECVEVVPQEWYAIEAMRSRLPSRPMNFLHRFEPREHTYSQAQKLAIATGASLDSGWVGDQPEEEWASAHAYFIEDKVAKLKRGNYKPLRRLWLVMQDEWRVPMSTVEEKMLAFSKLLPKAQRMLRPPSFERVFLCSDPILFELSASEWNLHPLENWWR